MTELTEIEKTKNKLLYKEAEEVVALFKNDLLQIIRANTNGNSYHGELFSCQKKEVEG